jgi:hypothetical protein
LDPRLALFGRPGTWDWGCDEDFWPWLLEAGAGVVEDPLVVVLDDRLCEGELEVELEVLEPDELLELGGALVVLAVVVEVLEPALAGVHEPARSVAPAGRVTCDGVVPGGTLTVKVSVAPVRSLTVTVHVSADAGALPKRRAAHSVPSSAGTAISLGRRFMAALTPPTNMVRAHSDA